MILVTAFKKYFALDAKQKEFIKSGQRIFMARPEEILKILRPLAGFDQDCDAARSQCGLFMVLSFLFGFIMVFVGAANDFSSIFFAILVIIPALIFITLLVAFLILKSIDIHNNLREFVIPVLNTVSQDMDPNEKIRIKIDLRGKCIPAKLINTRKHDPGWFQYPKTTTYSYKDNWLDASATLYDGSKLFFSVSDMVDQIKMTKKGRSGKTKFKTKYKIKSRLKVGLALKNKSYLLPEQSGLGDTGEKVKQKQGQRRNVISLTKVQKFRTLDSTIQPGNLLDLVGKILMSAKPAPKQE